MRLSAIALLLLSCVLAFAARPDNSGDSSSATLTGTISDPSGAIVPGAKINLLDEHGAVVGSSQAADNGSFKVVAPHAGNFTLEVSEPGFDTVHKPVAIPAPKPTTSPSAPVYMSLHIIMKIAAVSTSVQVNAETNADLVSSEENRDSSVMTSSDLKELPVFDNDYASAMSAFLDDSATSTGGTGLLVDGVEANRATVSPSAVQEVRINQDPYSAQYYWPGRGQMEIITKSAADKYHGQFDFLFRNSAMNAKNALAATKPFEQRRVYDGHIAGPVYHFPKSGFLITFNRAEEDQDQVVNATILPTTENPSGSFSTNVPSPTRDLEFSERISHQFGEKHSAYIQHSYENWTGQNQGVGGQTLASAAYNARSHENDFNVHVDSTLSPTILNQFSLIVEVDSNHNTNVNEMPRISVSGDFNGGSAQSDSLGSELNFRFFENMTWMHGHHTIKFGVGLPHLARREYDDHNNEIGSYTFAPTVDTDGITVLQTALQNYANNLPSTFSQNTGDTNFIYHQQEVGSYIQDQWNINSRLSITPGIRYDWQKSLADNRIGFSPRASFAWVLNQDSKMVLRGGGGIYFDRTGAGVIRDLVRYQTARRRAILVSLDPATEPAFGCMPITNCTLLTAQPPMLMRMQPHPATPYDIQYGLSIERQVGEKATATISTYSMRTIKEFRSVDINAPTPQSGYTLRPDPTYGRIRQMQTAGFTENYAMDIQFRGRVDKYFSGFGRYTWSHIASNNGGIGWYPQNQYAPNDEWSDSGWDRRHRVGMYMMFNSQSIMNLSAGVWANTGAPWTIQTGTDPYGDGLYNARPDGVQRNSERMPSSVNLDMRWGHDFHLTKNREDESPQLGFSVGAFNILNHANTTWLNPVITSPTYMQRMSVSSPRRIQLAMRFQF